MLSVVCGCSFRSPSCVATFQYWPLISLHPALNQQLDSEQKQRFVECCPTKVYGYNVDSRQVEVEDASKCMFCMEVRASSRHSCCRRFLPARATSVLPSLIDSAVLSRCARVSCLFSV